MMYRPSEEPTEVLVEKAIAAHAAFEKDQSVGNAARLEFARRDVFHARERDRFAKTDDEGDAAA